MLRQHRYEGHQFSDYVLLGKDAKPSAVVEAKRTSKDAAFTAHILNDVRKNRKIKFKTDNTLASREVQFLH